MNETQQQKLLETWKIMNNNITTVVAIAAVAAAANGSVAKWTPNRNI